VNPNERFPPANLSGAPAKADVAAAGYPIFGPLQFYEVMAIGYTGLRPRRKLDPGLCICQPLYGRHMRFGKKNTPGFQFTLKVVAGSSWRGFFEVILWATPTAMRRSTLICRALGLPTTVLQKEAVFRGGLVLADIRQSLEEDGWEGTDFWVASMQYLRGPDDIPTALQGLEFDVQPWTLS
jgi:hypothetical protein